MPRKSEWNHKLGEIIPLLEGVQEPILDRSHIEELFQTGPRQAVRIMRRLGAEKIGGALVIERQLCLERLHQLAAGESMRFEQRRRARFAEKIDAARREARSRQVVIPAPESPVENLERLPPEIELRLPDRNAGDGQGELRVRFSDPVELLQRLLVLSQAFAEDWEGFAAAHSPPGPGSE